MRLLVAGILVVSAMAGCIQQTPDGPSDGTTTPPPPGDPIRFLAIGDMGTGEEPQMQVAAAMEDVCAMSGCDFVIGLGDNIYEVGVTSPYDPQFETKFEQPYAAFDIPFYMSLGNHDNAGVRSGHATGDFQVDYAARDDRTSDKWVMPDRWYLHEQGPLRFMALDTNIVFSEDGTGAQQGAPLLSEDPDGVEQAAWIDANVPANASVGGWTILYGHHPLYSNGDHGDAGGYLGQWLGDAVCSSGHVDLYITGHDHDLQWLEAKPDQCGKTQFLTSGAAAKTRSVVSDRNPAHFTCGDTHGFLWVDIVGERMTGRFHDSDGTVLYEAVYDRSTEQHEVITSGVQQQCTYGS